MKPIPHILYNIIHKFFAGPGRTVLMFLFVHNVCGGLEIIKTDYQHEEVISGDRCVMFEFHLETIQGSSETEAAVKNLIYQGLSIDDYIAHKINWFMGHPENYEDDGENGYVEYITVHYAGDSFAIFQYDNAIYYANTWYTKDTWGFHIVDLAAQKILELHELMQRVPDDELQEIVLSQNDMFCEDLGAELWPPDTFSFEKDGVLFVWRSYSKILLIPQRYEIHGKLDYEYISPRLTDKGKELMRTILQ
jgi:hypothetical protein